jgi:hypothetical protein
MRVDLLQEVGLQRLEVIFRQSAGFKQPEGGDGQALGPVERFACRAVVEAPGRPGAGVEQHRDDGEIELGARPLGRIGPGDNGGALGPEVAAADRKMAPARMEGDLQIGIVGADHRRDQIRGRLETSQIDAPVDKPAIQAGVEQLVRPLADGGGAQQRTGGGGGHAVDQNSFRSRPTTWVRSADTASAVK